MSSAAVQPSSEAAQLLQTFAPNGTRVEFVETTAADLQSTPEGQAWLEASRALREKYKHALVIEPAGDEHTKITALTLGGGGDVKASGDGGAFNDSAAAVGSVVSLVLKFTVQITSNDLRKQFNADNWGVFLTIPGFLAGTLYYNDVTDLKGNTDGLLAAATNWFSVTFVRSRNDGLGAAYATFQAGVVGLPIFPQTAWCNGSWSDL